MAPEHLLQIANGLAEANTGRPRRADLCRAVSTAYYAMFHCLARTCADRLAGSGGTVGSRPMWRRAYRAAEHRQAKARCGNVPSSFPAGVREFGQAFSVLQRSGKGSHRNYRHPKGPRVTISGGLGDDARPYQEREVRRKIEESQE